MRSDLRRVGLGRPLPKGLHLLPLFLAILAAMGCSRPVARPSAIVTDLRVVPQPARVGPVTVSFSLRDHERPVTGAHVSLEGDMTHAGMAPVFADAAEVAQGRYQGELTLNMAGDWVVLLHIRLANGQNLEQQIPLSGVQSR